MNWGEHVYEADTGECCVAWSWSMLCAGWDKDGRDVKHLIWLSEGSLHL